MTNVARGAARANRRTGRDDRERVFFGGCNYLGLAHDGGVLAAARAAAERFGVGSGAARGTSGTCALHVELETELAAFAGAEDAALFPDTALADLAVALAFVGDGERVWSHLDAHPCVTDAVRAAAGRVVFGDDASIESASADGCTFAFTDGTFPSAARVAPVERLLAVGLERVVIDDAHGFGLLGERGVGAGGALDLASDRQVLVVALSKCLGSAGGAVIGSRATIDAVRATSPYACTTAPAPPVVAAALAALRTIRSDAGRRVRAFANAERLHATIDAFERARGFDTSAAPREVLFPVRALAASDATRTAALHRHLLAAGVDVPLVRYPGGPSGDHLRFAVTSEHDDADFTALDDALGAWSDA